MYRSHDANRGVDAVRAANELIVRVATQVSVYAHYKADEAAVSKQPPAPAWSPGVSER